MELHYYGQNDDRYCFQQYWDFVIDFGDTAFTYCAGFGTLENSFQGGRHLFCVDHFPKPSPLICLLDIHLWLNVIGWWFQSVYKLNFKTDQADVGWFAPMGGRGRGVIKLQFVMFFRELNKCYFVMQKNTTALFDFFLVNITWPKIFPNNRTSPLPSFCSRHLFFVCSTPITVHVGVSS